MPGLKTLVPAELDQMVVDLFMQWGHVEWFWRDTGNGMTQDMLLRSNMMRSTQIARAGHRDESILNWIAPDSPRILFVAAMAFCSPDDLVRKVQSEGLFSAIAEHWEPAAINQAFTWMQGPNSDNWRRCRKAIKKEKGCLEKHEFRLFDNLSDSFQDRLNLCSGLGVKPTVEILQNKSSNMQDPTVDSGLFFSAF